MAKDDLENWKKRPARANPPVNPRRAKRKQQGNLRGRRRRWIYLRPVSEILTVLTVLTQLLPDSFRLAEILATMAQRYTSTFCGTQKQRPTPCTSIKVRASRKGWGAMRTLGIATNIRLFIITSGTPDRMTVQPRLYLLRVKRWTQSY